AVWFMLTSGWVGARIKRMKRIETKLFQSVSSVLSVPVMRSGFSNQPGAFVCAANREFRRAPVARSGLVVHIEIEQATTRRDRARALDAIFARAVSERDGVAFEHAGLLKSRLGPQRERERSLAG